MRRRAALRGGHVAPLPHAAVDGARECVVATAVEARALEAPRSHRHRPPGVAGRVDSHDEAVAVVVIVAVAAVVVLALLRRRHRRFTRRRPPTAPRAAAALAAVVAAEEPRGTVGAHEASVARARRHGHDGRAARTGLVCGDAARGAQQQWVVVLGARGGRVLLRHAAPPVAVEAAREHAAAPQPHLIRVRVRAQGSGLRAQGSGLRAQGSGRRAQGAGLGFRDSPSRTSVKAKPHTTSTASAASGSATGCGSCREARSPSPSIPKALAPHAHAVPAVVSAQQW
eukprot:scaffold25717_cov65-Phaeocystis_antarctica.AAC.1